MQEVKHTNSSCFDTDALLAGGFIYSLELFEIIVVPSSFNLRHCCWCLFLYFYNRMTMIGSI